MFNLTCWLQRILMKFYKHKISQKRVIRKKTIITYNQQNNYIYTLLIIKLIKINLQSYIKVTLNCLLKRWNLKKILNPQIYKTQNSIKFNINKINYVMKKKNFLNKSY